MNAPAGIHALPAAAGLSFKHRHWADIEARGGGAAWFEVHAENYMGAGGPPHRLLATLRALRPLSFHGVGLSIGGAGRLDRDHLARLRRLVDRYEPASFSEHLAWSTHGGIYFNDLLPLPYNGVTLARVCDHLFETQEALGRALLLENPASYLALAGATLEEPEFLAEAARRTGCRLLLDVNNVWISSVNRGFDPVAYLNAFPLHLVGEIHLAGHAAQVDAEGQRLLIDTHDRRVADDVWALYALVVARTGPLPTLIEWDNDIPAFPELAAEAAIAERAMAGHELVR